MVIELKLDFCKMAVIRFVLFMFWLSLCFTQAILAQQGNMPRILKHPDSVRVECLNILNSSSRETNLSVSPDGRHIFYMSDRGTMPWSRHHGFFKGQKRFDGDIWRSEKIGGQWQKPTCLTSKINTSSGEDEPFISPDGQLVYFQSWRDNWTANNGPYYCARLSGNEWLSPKGLGGGIAQYFRDEYFKHNQYATDGICVSADSKFFLVAAAPSYEEPMDIYMSKKDSNGKWQYLKKHPLSTKRDERTAFLAADSRTFYFASEGYGGFGGMDIFKTILNEDGTFGEIINIGAPFNTKTDDYGFVVTPSGNEAYFVRDGDLYYAYLEQANTDMKPLPTALLKGQVKDLCLQKNTWADIKIYDKLSNELVTSAIANSLTGEFLAILPSLGRQYVLVCTKNNLRISQDINLLAEAQFVNLNLSLNLPCPETSPPKTSAPPSQLALTLYFDFDSCALKASEEARLNQWLDSLSKYPPKQILSYGHTDAVGKVAYNKQLSTCRTQTILNFLRDKGVKLLELSSHAEGEEKPSHSNQTQEGRRRNRRVELVAVY